VPFFADSKTITDQKWEVIADILPKTKSAPGKRGSPSQNQWKEFTAYFGYAEWVRNGTNYQISIPLPNLPLVFSELGEGWCMGQTTLGSFPGFTRPGQDRYHRMLHRWDFRKCQKRGLSIGKTKKG
jgi:hypothetical protein